MLQVWDVVSGEMASELVCGAGEEALVDCDVLRGVPNLNGLGGMGAGMDMVVGLSKRILTVKLTNISNKDGTMSDSLVLSRFMGFTNVRGNVHNWYVP